ncbi:MAG: tRNA (N6-threonylcarbamoyladenosine(37)-N6)-methyltransferase TrmO [Candidatus Competibacteraceae bacterium]|nr:tRNA (N6-threonylcarbamoyladenosine(37)-N6)-methyltransferase TrmO [Candidatus Competibacteraceae bacterium]
MGQTVGLTPVGVVRSCFKEKFGIPRQPGLVPEARGSLKLLSPFQRPELVRGLEGFSHLWLIFLFHGCPPGQWSPTVRPPRLGGNHRLGVFATRSTFRPNPLGLSVVELEGIDLAGGVTLRLKGLDLLDGTPVVDIKPYLPYADSLPAARGGFASQAPETGLTVVLESQPAAFCRECSGDYGLDLEKLICQILTLDPRPAYRGGWQERGRVFGMRLLDFELRWRVEEGITRVVEIRLAGK